MFRSFMSDPNEKLEADIDKAKVNENIAAVNAAMEKVIPSKEFDKLDN